MNQRNKWAVRGALIAVIICGVFPIWPYWIYNSWEISQDFGTLPVALLGFVSAIREEGFVAAFSQFYLSDFFTAAFACSAGAVIGFFGWRKSSYN